MGENVVEERGETLEMVSTTESFQSRLMGKLLPLVQSIIEEARSLSVHEVNAFS